MGAPRPVIDYRGKPLVIFDPLRDLPQLIGWWDFSTLPGTDGAVITQVRDRSVLGHDLIQAVTGNRPTKQTAGDGKTVARFAATQFLGAPLFGAGWPVSTGFTAPITFAVTIKASSSNASFPVVVGGGSGGARAGLTLDAGAGKAAYVYGGTNAAGIIGPNVCDDTWHVIIGTVDIGGGAMYVDGNLTGALNSSLGTDVLKNLVVGALSNSQNQYLGDMREVMIMNGRLRFDQITALTRYLAGRLPTAPALGLCDASPSFEDTTSGNGQAVRILTPRTPSTPATLVLWSHPYSQTKDIQPGYWAYPIAHACLANGWTFAASAMHGDPWGNANGQGDLLDLYNLLNARTAFSKVVLVGASMGGVATALAVSNNLIPNTVGAYFIDAVLGLKNQYANALYTTPIATAYGITAGTLSSGTSVGATSLPTTASFPTPGTQLLVGNGTANIETVTTTGASNGTSVAVTATANTHASSDQVSDFPSKTAGFDPLLKSAATYATRMRFVASTADTQVLQTGNTDPFRTLVSSTAIESALVAKPGAHLVAQASNPPDLVAFIKRCIA